MQPSDWLGRHRKSWRGLARRRRATQDWLGADGRGAGWRRRGRQRKAWRCEATQVKAGQVRFGVAAQRLGWAGEDGQERRGRVGLGLSGNRWASAWQAWAGLACSGRTGQDRQERLGAAGLGWEPSGGTRHRGTRFGRIGNVWRGQERCGTESRAGAWQEWYGGAGTGYAGQRGAGMERMDSRGQEGRGRQGWARHGSATQALGGAGIAPQGWARQRSPGRGALRQEHGWAGKAWRGSSTHAPAMGKAGRAGNARLGSARRVWATYRMAGEARLGPGRMSGRGRPGNAWRCRALLGQVRTGRRGWSGLATHAPAGQERLGADSHGLDCKGRRGGAWLGTARRGLQWQEAQGDTGRGQERRGSQRKAGRAQAWRGRAGLGRRGQARLGSCWTRMAGNARTDRRGWPRLGLAGVGWRGAARRARTGSAGRDRQGSARHGAQLFGQAWQEGRRWARRRADALGRRAWAWLGTCWAPQDSAGSGRLGVYREGSDWYGRLAGEWIGKARTGPAGVDGQHMVRCGREWTGRLGRLG